MGPCGRPTIYEFIMDTARSPGPAKCCKPVHFFRTTRDRCIHRKRQGKNEWKDGFGQGNSGYGYRFSLEKANATALNDFTQHYAKIDFVSGIFEIYGEIAIADGFLKGEIKPILKDSKLVSKEDGFLETLWEGFTGFFKFLLKNQKNGTLATKVPLEGNLNNVGTKIWPTVINIFKTVGLKPFRTS